MRTLRDMWIMAKRSLRHTTRSLDTIITVVLTPIVMLLLFVYVFGGALGEVGTPPGRLTRPYRAALRPAGRANRRQPPPGFPTPEGRQ